MKKSYKKPTIVFTEKESKDKVIKKVILPKLAIKDDK